jgi:hypothetical protein
VGADTQRLTTVATSAIGQATDGPRTERPNFEVASAERTSR